MVVALAILDIPYNISQHSNAAKIHLGMKIQALSARTLAIPNLLSRKGNSGTPFYFTAPHGHSGREIHENRAREGNVSSLVPISK